MTFNKDGGEEDGLWIEDEPSGEESFAMDLGIDQIPANQVALFVPRNTQLCTAGDGMDALEYYLQKMRVTPKEGLVLLPLDQESFEAEWIEKLEVGPNGEEAVPDGPGTFNRSSRTFAGKEQMLFEYQKPYQSNGSTRGLVIRFLFDFAEGIPVEAIKVINNQSIKQDYLDRASSGIDLKFVCTFDFFNTRWKETYTAENGDKLEIYYLMWMGCYTGSIYDGCAGGSGYGEVAKAQFLRGLEERQVNNFFKSAFSAILHLGGKKAMVALDPPIVDKTLGDLHAVLIDEMVSPEALHYLDSNLVEVGSSVVVSTDTQYEW